ncbi:MAG: hypothetical protein D6719_05820 [Candidatus Dadabacteria bacterium]|nr:MAG: hypothetical protein D6719_05820 [Candidatus Dadabacteria bacterium]
MLTTFRFQLITITVTILLTLPSFAVAQNVTDFDNDQRSDFLVIQPKKNGALDWYVTPSGAAFSVTSSVERFGRLGNHLIPGNWFAGSTARIGVVSVKEGTKSLLWQVKTSGGSVVSREFGKTKHTFVSGADFNGNGIHDAAIIKPNGKVIVFAEMLASKVSGGPAAKQFELTFSSKWVSRGIPFIYSIDGKRDGIGFMRKMRLNGRKIRQYKYIWKDINNNTLTGRIKGGTRWVADEVVPVKSPSGPDWLAFISTRSNKTVVTVRSLGGKRIIKKSVSGERVVVVGDYIKPSGEEFAFKTGRIFRVINPRSGVVRSISSVRGIAADHININSFGSSPDGNIGDGDSDLGSPSGTCKSFKKVTTGILWKPSSDVSDSRGGKPVLLLRGSMKTGKRGAISIYDKNGQRICSLGYKVMDEPGVNGNSDHYYSGWPGGCGLTGSQMASAAKRSSGSSSVFVEWKGSTCIGPINPASRQGSI